MSNDSKLVTIYKPQDRAEYYVISGLLDSAGIEYFSLNEGVQNLLGAINQSASCIEIQVSEENVDKATELINAKPQLTTPPKWRNSYLLLLTCQSTVMGVKKWLPSIFGIPKPYNFMM